MESLSLLPTVEATAQLAPWLRHCANVFGISREVVFQINLGLEEWIANLLTHTRLTELGQPLQLLLEKVPDGLQLSIEDQAEPFDPMQVAVSPLSGSVDDTQIGGQGLHLIRIFCQELSYRPGPPNRLVLFYHVPA